MPMVVLVLAGFCLLSNLPADPPSDEVLNAYRVEAANVGRGADAHVRLALWCEAHGLEAERANHLAIAVLKDPRHRAARGLMGLVDDRGRWRKPEGVAERYRTDAGFGERMARYNVRRETIPDTAEAHWQMAGWCEQNGLNDESRVHLTAVVRLKPAREDAWKKLGYEKRNGHWATSEQVAAERAERAAQRKADARWRPLLARWKGWLAERGKRAEGETALARVDDPRAVPSVWKVFATGTPEDQERASLLFRQIDAPAASRALASMALVGETAEVRRRAADGLIGLDPRDFAGLLIGQIHDALRYEVRRVGGPGMPGELYVQGERMNTRRFYAAPPPLATFNPGEVIGFDESGLPVANRVVGYTRESVAAAIDPLLSGAPDLTGAPDVLANSPLGETGRALGQTLLHNQQQTTALGTAMSRSGASFSKPLVAQVPVGRLMVEAQQQAEQSRQRLNEDVAALDRYNTEVHRVNERATLALRAAVGEDPGNGRADWVKWWSAFAESISSATPRPRADSQIAEADQAAAGKRPGTPSFVAGTPVWTLTGLRPIEDLRAGDQVLTQDVATGALSYSPLLTIRHTRSDPVKPITLGDVVLVATDLERFWVAGKGWTMMSNLRPGDVLRALGGVVRVTDTGETKLRPVFQVRVEGARGIFVGPRGVLAHDDQPSRQILSPFDAPGNFDATAPRRKN